MATDLPKDDEGATLFSLRRSLVGKTISVTDELASLPESQRSRMLLGVQTAVVARRRFRRRSMFASCAALVILIAGGLTAFLHRVNVIGAEVAPTHRSAEWEEADLGEVGHLRIRVGTDYLLPAFPPFCERDATRVELRSGALCAQVNHRDSTMVDPLVIATPDLVVEVVGTEFCIEAWRGVSVVDVSEGVVRVHAGEHPAISVGEGETLTSNDARLAVVTPTPLTVPPKQLPIVTTVHRPSEQREVDCAGEGDVRVRRRCFAALALGSDVRAANALYALALIDAEQLADHRSAISELTNYQARFPAGILLPEVSVTLMSELATLDRPVDAVDEADRFRARFPTHPRLEDVTLMEGNLLLNRLDRPAEAVSLYRTLVGRPLTAGQRASLDNALRRAIDVSKQEGSSER